MTELLHNARIISLHFVTAFVSFHSCDKKVQRIFLSCHACDKKVQWTFLSVKQ